MDRLIDIYSAMLKAHIATFLQYRAAMLIWAIGIITESMVYMAVWNVVAQDRNIDGFTPAIFSAYYITWMLTRHIALAYGADEVAYMIRTGDLSPRLLSPLHPIHRDIGFNLGFQIASLPVVLITITLLSVVFPPSFAQTDEVHIIVYLLAVLFAAPIRFLGAWVLGLLGFWLTNGSGVFMLYYTAEIFLSGRIAPLPLFPEWMMHMASMLPFRWMLSFPVEVLLGILTPLEILQGFLMQFIWFSILLLLLRQVWQAGIKQYGAVGA